MSLKSLARVFALFFLIAPVWADPPERVGRISYLEGSVSFHANVAASPADNENAQWAPAQRNYPVTNGNALWADTDARFELQIGAAEVRADHQTEIDIERLDDEMTLLRVDQGVVNVHWISSRSGRFAIATPEGQIDLVKPGSYHVEVAPATADEPPQVQITTLEGEARLSGARAEVEILAGERAIIDDDPVNVSLREGDATDFDNWALSRERREQESLATRYVSPEITGYQDLDDAGRWTAEPDYGEVWYPAVASDWVPYRYGHWVYVEPWGWTWVDDEPWGFAPFHYGRWVYIHHAWGWCPGERVVHPIYAPALVAFVGSDHWRAGVSVGARPIGWVPLGPHEVYRPYYAASANYIRDININHVDQRIINNVTINDVRENNFRNREATTVVAAETFAHKQSIHDRILPISRDDMAQAASIRNPNQSESSVRGNNEPPRPMPMARIPKPIPNTRSENPMRESQNVRTPPSHPHWEARMPIPQHPQELPPHPMQATQIHPTAHGWQRAQMSEHSPPAHQDERRPQEERRSQPSRSRDNNHP